MASFRYVKLLKVLLVITLILVAGVVCAYYFRLSLIQQGVNQWGRQHQVTITALTGVEFQDGFSIKNFSLKHLAIKHIEIKHLDSVLIFNNIKINFDQDLTLPTVTIADTQLNLAYDSYQWWQSLSSENSVSAEINLSIIPNVSIGNIKITLIDFPNKIINKKFSHLELQQLQLKPLAQPMFKVKLFVKHNISDKHKVEELLVAGTFALNLDVNDELSALSWQLQSNNLDLSDANQWLIKSLFIAAAGRIELKPQLVIKPIRVEFNYPDDFPITTQRCRQLVSWFKTEFDCEVINDQEQISLKLAQPLSSLVTISSAAPLQFDVVVNDVLLGLNSRLDKINLGLKQLTFNQQQISANWKVSGETKRFPDVKALNFDFSGEFMMAQQAEIKLKQAKIQAASYRHDHLAFNNLEVNNSQDITLNINQQGFTSTPGAWQVKLSDIKLQDIAIAQISGEINSQLSQDSLRLNSQWLVNEQIKITSQDVITLNSVFNSALTPRIPLLITGQWQLDQQAVIDLLTIKHRTISDIIQQLRLVYPADSAITTTIEYQVEIDQVPNDQAIALSATINGQAQFEQVKYQDIIINDFRPQWQCDLIDNADIDFKTSCAITSSIAEIDTGVMIYDLNSQLNFSIQKNNNWLKLNKFNAQLFGGEISVVPLIINDHNRFNFNVDISDISLAEIVKLQQREGITVTGLLSGRLPIAVVNQQLSIKDGYLKSSALGGVIQIANNDSVNQLRLSQPKLSLLFDTLEDFTYRSLSSTIDYKNDGWADFKVSIYGRSPAIERPVEFNYSHQENILQLIRSLQIGDQISEQLEKTSN